MHPVLLIGSFPPSFSAKEVFTTAGRALAGVAKRLPDGEVQGWATFPQATLAKAVGLEHSGRTWRSQPEMPPYPLWRMKPGLKPEDVRFAPVGYDKIASASYAEFLAARREGAIAPGTKFQVSLPTPFATMGAFVVAEEAALLLPVFERQYLTEVDTIVRTIPAEDLAIQWDVAVEIVQSLEGHRPGLKDHATLPILSAALGRAISRVPANIECGVHLCYGNPGGRHIIEPKDTGTMVTFANAVFPTLTRPLSWMHMPVPISRDDDAYFAPLKDLRLPAGTEFYLGLVHLSDGVEGATRRMAAAKRHAPYFGVGYECGLRAFKPETIGDMLALHKTVAAIE